MPVYQLLVRVADKVNTDDPVLDACCMKRGDVVATKLDADAWWTPRELSNPDWTIIKVDLSEAQVAALTAAELPPDLTRQYRMLRKRGLRLDLDALGVPAAGSPRADKPDVHGRAAIVAGIKLKRRLREPDQLEDPASIVFRGR